MKTIKIAISLLAAAALTLSSCVKEEMGSEPMTFAQNELAFKIGSVATKAATQAAVPQVFDIATVKPGDGSVLVFQDEVSSLDSPSALQTKGTPAYTENVLALYGTFNAVALLEDGSSAFSEDDVTFTNKQDNVWQYLYRDDIWDDSKFPTYFFMRMPGTAAGVTLADDPYDVEDGSISFHYKSPGSDAEDGSAVAQQDILFTSHKRTEKVNGETITFYHALTGVKFANHFRNNTEIEDNKTETLIRKVEISGLKNEGDCVVTPLDDIDHPSVGNSKDAAVWSNVDGNVTFTQTFGEAFAEYGSNYKLDEKLNEDAAKQNLNDADGTRTFWFVPQTLTSDVKIKVTFDIRVNGNYTFQNQVLEVSLGDALAESHKTWQAGELHTFTLRPEKVGVDIEDTMDSQKYVKTNVRITNTGNVDQYVRVYIIGNWFGKRQISAGVYNDYESILMGYTTETGTEEVARWNDKDFTWSSGIDSTPVYEKWASPAYPEGYDYTPFGTFVGLPEKGTSSAPGLDNGHNWKRHDKFYYYTELIGPGDDLPSTEPLFESYTINASPTFWIADMSGVRRKAKDVHFVMDIAVQAISVPYNEDGTPVPYEDAWKAALGVDNINDI